MEKVGIIGHYGFGHDLANGQTIKTKIITDELDRWLNEKVHTVDVHGGIKRLIPTIFNTIRSLKMCNNVIILLAENGLKVCVPILAVFNKLFKRSLHYIVIGGWLASYLQKNSWLIKYLKQFKAVYVETSTMKNALEKLGFNNIVIMPNCKNFPIISEAELKTEYREPRMLCTFSRVMAEKGIEDAIYAVDKINKHYKRTVYRLTIYGQVDAGQTQWFEDLKKEFPEYVTYGGVVPFTESVDVLKECYALLFPTRFYTEGIPGTIIDAYAAGLPVISSKWESFSDVIEDGVTGYGYEFNNTEALYEILSRAAADPDMVIKLKKNCILKARGYTAERGTTVLKNALDI